MNANPRSATAWILYVVLAGAIMGYGWGYRGTVGHEAGAMVPGALLGLALEFRDGRLYIAWPPKQQDQGYLVFERADD